MREKTAKSEVVPARWPISRRLPAEYGRLVFEISNLLEQARRGAFRSVNAILTATYWEIGRRIVEHEQRGKARAEYGKELLSKLGNDLTRQHGRGFSARNLRQMRAFYLGWEIWQTPSAKLEARVICPALLEEPAGKNAGKAAPRKLKDGYIGSSSEQFSIVQTPSAKLHRMAFPGIFPPPWSQYVRLLAVEKTQLRP